MVDPIEILHADLLAAAQRIDEEKRAPEP